MSAAYSCGQQWGPSHLSIFTLYGEENGLGSEGRARKPVSCTSVPGAVQSFLYLQLLRRKTEQVGGLSVSEKKKELKNRTQKSNTHSVGKNDYNRSQLNTFCISCWPR